MPSQHQMEGAALSPVAEHTCELLRWERLEAY